MTIWVRNNTAATIPRGRAVYSDGVAGGLPRVALAMANAASTMPCIGVTLEPIDNSQDGRIGTLETVLNMDTSSFALADLLYVSASVAGALTATAPASPNITQRVGRVTAVDARDGRLSLNIEQANFAQDGMFEIRGTAPELRFNETDQVGAAGMWRWLLNGNNLNLDRNTAAARDFSTLASIFTIGSGSWTIDTISTIFFGSATTSTVGLRLYTTSVNQPADTGGAGIIWSGLDNVSATVNALRIGNATGHPAGINSAYAESIQRFYIGVLGSPAQPAAAFTNDADTGIYSSGANSLDFAAGGLRGLQVALVGAARGLGFFNVAAAIQQTSGANLTNSVTAGGVNDTIANFTDLVTYGNDAATIRNDIYQLARQLKQVNDALRLYGLLT